MVRLIVPEGSRAALRQVQLTVMSRSPWLPRFFALVALALLPWSLWLSIWLPSEHRAAHWDIAWAGFDLALAAMLGLTALGLYRRALWLPAAAAAAATLLVCDAWFDILTSRSDEGVWLAAAMAAFGEIPLAVLCILIAVRAERTLERTLRLSSRRSKHRELVRDRELA
jgi:hypothetical protein